MLKLKYYRLFYINCEKINLYNSAIDCYTSLLPNFIITRLIVYDYILN